MVVVEGQVVTVTTAAAVVTAAVAALNKLLLNFVATDRQCSSSFADQHCFWCLVLDPESCCSERVSCDAMSSKKS